MRQAVNAMIQGSASEILKKSTVLMNEQILELEKKCNVDQIARIVMLLHDEIIFEVSEIYEREFIDLLNRNMPTVEKLSVDLPIKIKRGYRWGGMEKIFIEKNNYN